MPTKTLDVDQLTSRIQALLLQDPVLQSLSLRGEILELKRHTSGHVYFTLTGRESRISCVMFRSDANTLPRWPRKGDEVIVQGRVSIYPPRGAYQFYARQIYPLGEGAAARAKVELRQKLEKEGLFDAEVKRPIPEFPTKVAVITSPTGAALRDVINVSGRLFPICELVVVPATVQGADAPLDIRKAFSKVAYRDNFDAVLLVRGGGSRDDLNPFDDEYVVRSVRSCPCPVITGLGHETDLTLADLAADKFASTPSAATETLLPDIYDVLRRIVHLRQIMLTIEKNRFGISRQHVKTLLDNGTRKIADNTHSTKKELNQHYQNLQRFMKGINQEYRQKVANLSSHLKILSPLYILSRGFITCEEPGTGKVIPYVRNLKEGNTYTLRFADGAAETRIVKIKISD